MDAKQKPQKEKRRNNEKRKEKSRDAARCRRSREVEIFTDLSGALPLPQDQVSQLDKASVMRLAISYLKTRDMIKLVEVQNDKEDKMEFDESSFLKSMDGFVLAISSEGDFIFVSQNVSDYLGITQIDLMGQNIYDYSHPCDHDEIKDILSGRSKNIDTPKSFFLRLKCTLTSKGRSVNLKSATYKVIHCTGHLLQEECDENKEKPNTKCLVTIGQPIPHPSNIETPLPKQTFLTKHSLDLKFTYADDKMLEFLGYNSEDLLGKSAYEYHHASDSDSISLAYKCLFSKGQCETNRYKFLAKTGGYVWVLTQATLIYDKVQKPQSVVCVNYVISGIECEDEIYSTSQLSSVKSEIPPAKVCNTVEEIKEAPAEEPIKTVIVEKPKPSRPISVTAKIFGEIEPPTVTYNRPLSTTSTVFAPRTEDMNKGFLTFSEEDGLTMMKDEPDDLTHLAPVAGEVVSFEDQPFLSDMLDDFLLRDGGFCPLMTDDQSDPFLTYRDTCALSPQLLSPIILKGSECSLPTSPSDSLGEDDQMSSFMTLQLEDDSESSSKAPYIPMNMGDDLPLLLQDDVWKEERKKMKTPENTSSLAELLSSGVNKNPLKPCDRGKVHQATISHNLFYDKKINSNIRADHRNDDKIKNHLSHNENNKRISSTTYDTSNKRTKCDPKDLSSELFQQLISTNNSKNRPKSSKTNWSLDSGGGGNKTVCASQPNDSVLMNLLDRSNTQAVNKKNFSEDQLHRLLLKTRSENKENNERMRKSSTSLLNPESVGIPSLLDLTQQDCEVNAPVNTMLLQGEELITALEVQSFKMVELQMRGTDTSGLVKNILVLVPIKQ